MSQCNDAIRPIFAATMLALMISACGGAGAHVKVQFERPAVIRFGASAAELERELEGQCTQRQLRTDDPVFLPNVRKGQQWQIDCDRSLKQLPARHAMGVGAFSADSRAADLRNGGWLYSVFGVLSALSGLAVTIAAYGDAELSLERSLSAATTPRTEAERSASTRSARRESV